jgi:hypothetical protein
MTAPPSDPAEQGWFLRLCYRDWRPTLFGRWVNRFWTLWSGLGLPPQIMLTLRVPGRKSGRLRTNVLVAPSRDGKRYLVSMLGQKSEWVLNLRANGGRAYIKQGRTKPAVLTEVPVAERAPIIKEYCRIATSGRHHFPVPYDAPVSEFERIAPDYPVFRIDAA